MQKFLLIVLLAACLALALAIPTSEQTLRRDFTLWMKNHAKSYSTDQFQDRFQVWKRNALWIEEFNQRNATTYQVAMNEFGDLTSKEFGRIYNGLLRVERSLPETIEEVDVLALPSSVDWRKEGLVTGIKNQQQCGSCWAFSTTGSMEGAHARTTGKLISLSEQNLVDCSSTEGNEGCNGGLMDYAFEYIIQNKGIDTEASYPYTAEDGTCTYKKKNCASTLAAYTDVQAGSESALQAAVAAQGPISVAIDASHSSFQFYSGGVYYEANCSPTSLDHGVLAVGYGTQSGKDYWIVKNSWGTDWGLSGYILMSRNRNNNCGIATAASFPQRAGALACP